MDGIINVYKERGYTSHDVVAKLRRVIGQKKIGHTGTLDPEARGVLPVCLGKATKVCSLLTDQTKTYRAVLLLGVVTDTQDMTGEILEEQAPECGEQEVRRCMAEFTGDIAQVPPMYSALKVNGKKLYELARQGLKVERKPRTVTIHELVIEEIRLPEVEFTVTCSKGTYIRTLCHDIGRSLGCGGAMKSLLRTRVGMFSLEDSFTLEEIQRMKEEGRLEDCLTGADRVFEKLESLRLTEQDWRLVKNGNALGAAAVNRLLGEAPEEGRQYRIYSPSGEFAAVYAWNGARRSLCPVKMF